MPSARCKIKIVLLLTSTIALVFLGATAEGKGKATAGHGSRGPVDIAVADIGLDDRCRVRVTFQNKGTDKLRKTFPYALFVNRIQVRGSFLQTELEPGESVTVEGDLSGHQVLGTAVIEVQVDPSNTLGEEKKTLANNRLKKKLTCKGDTTFRAPRPPKRP